MRAGYRQSPEHVRRRMASRLATLAVKSKPVSQEWLVREYLDRNRNCVQIGSELGRDAKTVWSWLRHYGIPTRARGTASSSSWFRRGYRNAADGRRRSEVPRKRRARRTSSSESSRKEQRNVWIGRHHSQETRERLRAIALADGRVPYDPVIGSYMKGRRGALATNWKGGITPERQAFYASQEWRVACKAVWRRANALCERCGADHRDSSRRSTFHVHHIVGFAATALRAVIGNLALLCGTCHRFVHSKANIASEFLGGAK